MLLIITVAHDRKSYVIDLDEMDRIVVGRSDISTGALPTVDLHDYGAQSHGVSREHAVIHRTGEHVFIEDRDSANGTFVHDVRLFPHQPRLLRHGDVIRLGKLAMQIRLAHPARNEAASGAS
jgi:pSer/pThr/pTyr-binding forkhead associated (FHA) protein